MAVLYSRIVEGFISEFKVMEPSELWRNKTISSRVIKKERTTFVKQKIITPLHPPVRNRKGFAYIYKDHQDCFKYDITEDDLRKCTRNECRVLVIGEMDLNRLNNTYAKLKCKIKYDKYGRDYLELEKIIKVEKRVHKGSYGTLALEFEVQAEDTNILNILEETNHDAKLYYDEYLDTFYKEVYENVFMHYKFPGKVSMYIASEIINKQSFNKNMSILNKAFLDVKSRIQPINKIKIKLISDRRLAE